MYKYKCSRNECGSTWLLKEGCLNGFTLTCPTCGKGRGLFVEQVKEGREDSLDHEARGKYKNKGWE